MPLTAKQVEETNRLNSEAISDPIKVKVTGSLFKKDSEGVSIEMNEDGKHVLEKTEKATPKMLGQMTWGWMGKHYGPDENGFMREILSEDSKTKKRKFGAYIPRAAFIHHRQTILTSAAHSTKFEVVEVNEPTIPLSDMGLEELKAFAATKGLSAEDTKSLNKKDLIELLSK